MFDTDVLIFLQRGNTKALKLVESAIERRISIFTYMELLQSASSKKQHKVTKDFLHEFDIMVIPFTDNTGHRAAVYIEEYSLSHGIRAGDAVIAASAVENNLTLHSANKKHFKCINELSLDVFNP